MYSTTGAVRPIIQPWFLSTVGMGTCRFMEIVKYPHPALRWKSSPVQAINAELRSTVREMFELMYEANGIGLAANQVALPIRLFVLNLLADPAEKEEEYVFINPEIIRRKGNQEAEEGCLSMPNLYGDVRRAGEIVVQAYGLDGQGFELTVDELASRAIQHETDHLDGVLFTDRMTEAARREIDPMLTDFETLFRRQQEQGKFPSDAEIQQQLQERTP
ncbi:Peptide deformylase [Symmachiella dynata]|uniref:Peptide deformylase n=2 Tax=Symmachiella dynata TaxID=2527995 RepID=A0A517ZXG4_9PLAN|nr:Peptide deformylase [Symmachiella dynata]QDU47135.1 Peptide deformylase [Symmachiella dynata]